MFCSNKGAFKYKLTPFLVFLTPPTLHLTYTPLPPLCKLTLFSRAFFLSRNKIAWKKVRAGKKLSHGGKCCRAGGNLLVFREFSSLNSNFQLFRKKKSVFEHFHLWLFLDKSVSLHPPWPPPRGCKLIFERSLTLPAHICYCYFKCVHVIFDMCHDVIIR